MTIRSAICATALACTALMTPGGAHAADFMQFFAVLDAGNESDGGKAGAAGTAMVMLASKTGQVCFAILVRNLDTPSLAHIHSGAAGVDGGIVVTLTPPTSGNPGSSSGCVTGVSSAVIKDIKAHPTKYYVNVHSTAKPGGALRGQLF